VGTEGRRELAGTRETSWPSLREWPHVLLRAGKAAVEDEVPMMASALAFSAFLAIPSILLLALGLFTLFAQPSLVNELTERFGAVIPEEAVTLVSDSLLELQERRSSGVVMTGVGLVLALWTTTGAVSTLMTAVNRAHDLDDDRGFLRKRAVAVLLVAALGVAVVLVAGLLVLGPHIQVWVGRAADAERAVAWAWWTAQWPVLLVVLTAAFAIVFALATDGRSRRWRVVSPGAVVAVVVWLLVSTAFAVYASRFGAYNKTWGSLSVAIVTLVWLWLSGMAILFGAEVNAERDDSRAARGSPSRRRRPVA